jgi:hypothetical protein
MPRPVTLADLVDNARLRADMESSSFVTDSEVGGYCQQSATGLYDIILSAWGERYFFSQADLATVANQAYVNLPDDFYRLLKVGWVIGTGADPVRMEPFQSDEEWAQLWGGGSGWDQGNPPKYQPRGNLLYLNPTPTSVQSLRLQYVPIMPAINDGGLVPVPFQGVNGWDEWITLDVAIKLRIKEESDVRDLQTERAQVEQRIRSMAPRRDMERTHKIQRRRGRSWLSRYR